MNYSAVKNLTKESLGPDGLTNEFSQIFKKKNTNSTPTLQNIGKEKLSNSFYEARITGNKNIHFNGKTTDSILHYYICKNSY